MATVGSTSCSGEFNLLTGRGAVFPSVPSAFNTPGKAKVPVSVAPWRTWDSSSVLDPSSHSVGHHPKHRAGNPELLRWARLLHHSDCITADTGTDPPVSLRLHLPLTGDQDLEMLELLHLRQALSTTGIGPCLSSRERPIQHPLLGGFLSAKYLNNNL